MLEKLLCCLFVVLGKFSQHERLGEETSVDIAWLDIHRPFSGPNQTKKTNTRVSPPPNSAAAADPPPPPHRS